MKAHKVELLAPAGNYDSFIGTINAGADAVYVGGEKFSARAYADNFDTDTLCACIKYAHLFGKRVYLTLNTLIKENEFYEICDYVRPFYLAGLDGVIIQDFGVLRCLKENFPGMELHASTQMAVTGSEFVDLCEELGISRVVPARELSLTELKQIKDAGIEVECFVHGAMCYCYSGMCLMSSIIGGRSGNRGKCAQPCRLPYQVNTGKNIYKDRYTLSLKDMCTIEHIPALIEAGMDSFKIEGRMKRSEYAAGVTALYRKYIDLYYKCPQGTFEVSDEDKKILEHLYMRSELHDGYLFKHNGKEMITAQAPSYNGLDENVLVDIKEKYLGYTKKIPISIYAYFEQGKECTISVFAESGINATVNGFIVEKAQKAAATEENIVKQLNKIGNTHFELQDIQITLVGNCFLPNGNLNALRREALELLEKNILKTNFPESYERNFEEKMFTSQQSIKDNSDKSTVYNKLSILLSSEEQMNAVLNHSVIAYTGNLYLEEAALFEFINKSVSVPEHITVSYAMPYILRNKDKKHIQSSLETAYEHGIRHLLVRNVEELALINKMKREFQYEFIIITDASLYCWNEKSKELLKEFASRVTLPFELNSKELRPLKDADTEQIIYGYIPLMHTANCLFKTNEHCMRGNAEEVHKAELKDRYGKTFKVITNCKYCYNTIYNSVPLSLHKKYNKELEGTYRIQFSFENEAEAEAVLSYYLNWMKGASYEFPIKEYTTAHENRQVE